MAKALWTGAELLAMGFRIAPASAAEDLRITGVSIDSRGVVAGDLFVAIRGEARDGHDFARRRASISCSRSACRSRPWV